jgi:hypothetical protein
VIDGEAGDRDAIDRERDRARRTAGVGDRDRQGLARHAAQAHGRAVEDRRGRGQAIAGARQRAATEDL